MISPQILCSFLLLSSAAGAQISAPAGGASTLIHQYDGGAPNDFLGGSVANAGDVNGDGIDDQLIGAGWSSPGGISQAGSAFVYSGADGSLLYQFNGSAIEDHFGSSLAGAGDINGDGFADFILGVPDKDLALQVDTGMVLVISGADGSVLHQLFGPAADSRFGSKVAAAGDLDGDGFSDFLIGVPGFVQGIWSVGMVRAYSGANGTILHEIIGSSPSMLPLGNALAGTGDVNSDGYDDFILGANSSEVGGILYAGSAYVHSGFDGSIIYQYHGSASTKHLGRLVAHAGDVDRDGVDDFIIQMDTPTHEPSLIRVYSGASGNMVQEINDNRSYYFDSLCTYGDLDGDGSPDICVGMPFSTGGTVFVYSAASGELIKMFEGESSQGNYGKSLAFAGDQDGDGRDELMIGANRAGIPVGSSYGSAYVIAWRPLVSADTHSISASTGGTINLSLDFPSAAASISYTTLFSVAAPGQFFDGVLIPLEKDSWTIASYQGRYPFSSYTNLQGNLSASASASASFTVTSSQLQSFMIGRTMRLAVVASQSGSRAAEYSSIVVPIEITP